MTGAAPGTVLLTGGTGRLGTHLRPALEDRDVVLLSRRRPELQPNERWVCADLTKPLELPCVPAGSALCHLAYDRAQTWRNLDQVATVLAAVNDCAQVEHVVALSTTSVHGAATRGVVDESAPCRPRDDYARVKLAAEHLWRQQLRPDCDLTVLRPSAILTKDGSALPVMFDDALRRPLRAAVKRALQGRASVHVVAVDTVVAAVVFALDRGAHPRRALFLVTDDEAPENASYSALQDAIRAAAGRPPLPVRPLPRRVAQVLGVVAGRPLGLQASFSSSALREAGFSAPKGLQVPLEEAVRAHGASPGPTGRGTA